MSSMTTPIVDFVRQYARSGTSRLHMPGHKGQPFLGCEAWDITEIKGADELYEAEGIIARSEANATALFGTARTYYSTEGSSQCIRAMLALALQGAPKTGKRPVLLAARNAHKALRRALQTQAEQGTRPFGVYVTSPDYLGSVQDIAGLAAVCKARGVPLLVDNAHGAYLHFLPGGSRHPIALGAAMCCDSGHKTLPVLTGGAYLHLGPDAPVQDEATVRNTLNLFGSTSPSYLILQSLDQCNAVLAGDYRARLAGCCAALEALRKALNETAAAHGAVLPLALPGDPPDREPLKLTLDAAALGCSGQALAEVLRQHGIECEYADPRYLVLMFTPENPPQDYDRLREAITACCTARPLGSAPAEEDTAGNFAALARELAEKDPRCTIREAIFAPQEVVPAEEALGRVCAMPTVSCPPAIPIVVSGEMVSREAVTLMKRYGVANVAVIK